MNREEELRSQASISKSSPPRLPADGQEQLSSSGEEADTNFKKQQQQQEAFPMSTPDRAPSPDAGCEWKSADSNNNNNNNSDSPVPTSTPPYLRWAQNLLNLLRDLDGIKLFKQYLKQEVQDTSSLDFWFACEGIRQMDSSRLVNLIKLINRNYVRDLPDISTETKKEIANKIASKVGLDETIFDAARKEVETVMMKTTYPNFLRSDMYVQHVQRMQEVAQCRTPDSDCATNASEEGQPKQGGDLPSPSEASAKKNSSASGSQEKLDILPTVYEDRELQVTPSSRLTHKALAHRSRLMNMTGRVKPEDQAGHYLKATTPGYDTSYMKYASYLPPSAHDSELQSASSDAQTDDTMSVADSVDNYPVFRKACHNKLSRHHQGSKCNMPINVDHLPQLNFIPRTERLPERSTTKMPPKKFAELLIVKLNKLQDELKIKEELEKFHKAPNPQPPQLPANQNANKEDSAQNKTNSLSLFSFPLKLQCSVDTPQSILDEHICRVFDSTHQTPSPSPGCLTPPVCQRQDDASGGRRVPPCGSSVSQPSNVQNNQSGHYLYANNYKCGAGSPHFPYHEGSRQRRDRDTYSTDSGMQDFASDFELQSTHSRELNNAHRGSYPPADQSSSMPRRSYSKKFLPSDSGSSCVDSGVSLADVVSYSTTRQEKVTTWLEMRKYSSSHGSDSERDSQICHKKYPPSVSSSVGQSSKRMGPCNTWSGAVGGNNSHWFPQSGACGSVVENNPYYTRGLCSNVQPAQPFAQDPSMPLLPVPDTETQILEVKRRLEDDVLFRQQGKPKSLLYNREKLACEGARSKAFSKSFEMPEEGTLHRKSNRKSYPVSMHGVSKPPASSSTTDHTVVAYSIGRNAVPYLSKIPGKNVNLRQFKSLVSKKGNFRYFFKTMKDFGVVYEEVNEDSQVLPLWEGKIFSIVEPIE